MRRRQVLASAAAILGGGCLSLGQPDHAPIRQDRWDTSRGVTASGARVEGTVTVPEGRYAPWHFAPQQKRPLTIAVTASAAIDVLLLPRAVFRGDYEERVEPLEYYPKFTETDTTDQTALATVPAAKLTLVFDNSAVYGATPSAEAEVEFTIQV